MTFSEAIRQYLRWQRIDKEYSPHTIAARDANLRIILRHWGDIDIAMIDEQRIAAFKEWLHTCIAKQSKKLISRFTRHKRLSDLHEFLKFCEKQGWKTYDWRMIELPRLGEADKQWLTRSEIQKLIDGIPTETITGYRDRALIATLFASGMRISEALSLLRDSFDDQGCASVVGKGGKRRPVYITMKAREYLDEYLAKRTDTLPKLFAGHQRFSAGGRTIRRWKYVATGFGPGAAHSAMKMHGRRILGKSGIGCHTMRHSRNTDLIKSGCPLHLVQKIIGHKQLSSTERYTHFVDFEAYNAFQQFGEDVKTIVFERRESGRPLVKVMVLLYNGTTIDSEATEALCKALNVAIDDQNQPG